HDRPSLSAARDENTPARKARGARQLTARDETGPQALPFPHSKVQGAIRAPANRAFWFEICRGRRAYFKVIIEPAGCPLLAQSGHGLLHRICLLLTQSGHLRSLVREQSDRVFPVRNVR